MNENIIISSLATFPEHETGKERWQENKIGVRWARDKKKNKNQQNEIVTTFL